MRRLFRIDFQNKKSVVVVSRDGYASLIDTLGAVEDKENVYISPVSLFEAIKYFVSG